MLKLRMLLVLATFALPNVASAQGQYYYCAQRVGIPRARNSSYFVTRIYPVGSAAITDITSAWKKYSAEQQNPEVSSAECYTNTESNLSSARASQGQIWGAGKVVESDWQYSASMTGAPSKPGAVYAFCLSGDFAGNTVYETPVFEIPRSDAMMNNSPVEVTYVKYLIRKYSLKENFINWYSRSVGCPHSWDSREAAMRGLANDEAQLRKQKKSIVQTGWVYARNADTPPAQKPMIK